MIPDYFQISFRPIADPAVVVQAPTVRFSVLTSQLIRIEYSPTDQFEDRPSQVFWYRQQPVPAFTVQRTPDRLIITTEQLRLTYHLSSRGLAKDTLSVEVFATQHTWKFGDRDNWKNLRGTARTLDGVNGSVWLDRGLLSRAGWAVVDDSDSLVFNDHCWLEPRGASDHLDLYFFGYGHAYAQAVRDFCHVSGQVPLIPRYVLGNWWSRYWAYTQQELIELMRDFQAHEIPLSVCIVDMDWHITDTGNASSGWTGYTWNRNLFPDPASFIDWLHRHELRTALNLHPADGVYPHEERYVDMAHAVDVDPAAQQPIEFDIADPQFMQAYFEILHHPYEALGVDFWWLDWQQGARSKLSGLDPLMGLNHLHFYDLGRDGARRPFIFSRWFGLGNQRYPIGFSGDSVVSWESLAFQPYFTATASNVAYGWWSHDIGGHMQGIEDGELYARWVQFGVFSPILRLHSTNNPYQERRPWLQEVQFFSVIRDALQLRHQLIPYLYTMSWRNHVEGLSLITPMYYGHPEEEAAYRCPQQYRFGSELIAAPFTSPLDPDTRLSRQQVWLPTGEWFNFFTGDHYSGDRWITVYGMLDEIPVFAQAGAIVPLAPRVGWGGVSNPDGLDVHIFPHRSGRFELYEDDGETTAYQQGRFCLTTFEMHEASFVIEPGQGDISLVPAARAYRLIFRRIAAPAEIRVEVNGASRHAPVNYAEATQDLTIELRGIAPTDRVEITLRPIAPAWLREDRRAARCRRLLRIFRMESESKRWIDQYLDEIFDDVEQLRECGPGVKDSHIAALRSVIEGKEV
jgi:alpha-glucosidase (family GH31 glycosyl hydrolase)